MSSFGLQACLLHRLSLFLANDHLKIENGEVKSKKRNIHQKNTALERKKSNIKLNNKAKLRWS
jgi:hypothetical protein